MRIVFLSNNIYYQYSRWKTIRSIVFLNSERNEKCIRFYNDVLLFFFFYTSARENSIKKKERQIFTRFNTIFTVENYM